MNTKQLHVTLLVLWFSWLHGSLSHCIWRHAYVTAWLICYMYVMHELWPPQDILMSLDTNRCAGWALKFGAFLTLKTTVDIWASMVSFSEALQVVMEHHNCGGGLWMTASLSFVWFFTALHVMQTRYSEENSVRPSVCLFVRHAWSLTKRTRVIPDKTEERSVQIFIPYKRIFISLFWEEEWLVGGDPF